MLMPGTFGAFQQVIPVTSNPVVPIFREPVPTPEIGLRWGKVGTFTTSAQQEEKIENVTPKPPKNPTEIQHEVRIEPIGPAVQRLFQFYDYLFFMTHWFLNFYVEQTPNPSQPLRFNPHYAGYHTYPAFNFPAAYATEVWIPWGTDTLKEWVGTNPNGSARYQEHEVNWYLHVDLQGDYPGFPTSTVLIGSIPDPE